MSDGVRYAIALLVVGGGATACNAILGISDVPVPADAGAEGGAPEGGPDATTVTVQDGGDASSVVSDAPSVGPNDAPPGTDAPVCSDTGSDTHNCGRCGHDCLGGQCMTGTCQPLMLYPTSADAGASISPSTLTEDDSYLYWTDLGGSVNRTDKTSGATANLLPSTLSASVPTAIAVDDSAAYWGDANGIFRCAKTGCAPTPASVTSATGAVSMAVDDTGLYWSDGVSQILSVHKLGAGETGSVLWDGDASPAHVATDGERVYFTASDSLLRAVGVDGGAGFVIGDPSSAGSLGIALANGSVYWAVEDPAVGEVLGSSTSSPAAAPIASTQPGPLFVASDGTNVYWVNEFDQGQGQIHTCAIASCSPLAIAGGQLPTRIVVDATAIYWLDLAALGSNRGAIYKLAK
jgi:hypothetical protein